MAGHRVLHGTAAVVTSWLVRLASALLVAFWGALGICALLRRLQWNLEEYTDGHEFAYPLVLLFLVLWPVLELLFCLPTKITPTRGRRRRLLRPKWPGRSCARWFVDPIHRRLQR